MNNLHRELAPISDAAWAQIEEEAARTLKRYLAGRRIVDLHGPGGTALAAIGTGHLLNIASPGDGILARQREVKPLVELRVPFDLDRQMIDDVERGANDSDWQPAKDAAQKIAFAEDRAIFEGYPAGGIQGIRQGTSNPIEPLPAAARSGCWFPGECPGCRRRDSPRKSPGPRQKRSSGRRPWPAASPNHWRRARRRRSSGDRDRTGRAARPAA